MNDNIRTNARRLVTPDTVTMMFAFTALIKASTGPVDMVLTIIAVLTVIITWGVIKGIWRWFRPNMEGCGAPVDVGDQWTMSCGTRPPGHPSNALCCVCDPRTGLPVKE